MSKEKIITFSVVIIIIIISLALWGLILFKESGLYTGCVESDNGEVLCMIINKISKITPLAIKLDPVIPKPNEEFTTFLQLEFPCFTNPVSVAKLHLQTDNGLTLDTWDLLNTIQSSGASKGCFSVEIQTTFTAPSTAGDYRLFLSIFASGNPTYSEVKNFKVGSTSCPTSSCTRWNKIFDASPQGSGEVFSRQCSRYSSAPTCKETIKFQYKTLCNEGYVVKNTDSDVTNAIADCELKETIPTPTLEPTPTPSPTPEPTPTITPPPPLTPTPSPTSPPIKICVDYQVSENQECKFSFKNIITKKGASAYWNTYPTEISVVGVLLFIIISLSIYMVATWNK